MIYQLTITGDGIAKMIEATRVLAAPSVIYPAYAKALNHTGAIVQTHVGRALRDDTGLPYSTTKKAVKRVTRATASNLAFVINAQGGDISLKFFKPRETAKGVSAAPHNKRKVFAHTFMRGGMWPARKDLKLGGHVWMPNLGTNKWRRPFVKQKSGVIIPVEIVQGKSRQAFEMIANTRLPPRIMHEVKRATKGVLS